MLKMKTECEKCGAALDQADGAFICSYECTFCESCTHAMHAICPNCGGELVRRPRRDKKPVEVVVGQVKRKLGALLGLRGFVIATAVVAAIGASSVSASAVEIICASKDGRDQFCPVRTQGYVRLVKRYSGSPCIEGHTWGYDRRGIWVARGCRAKFEVGRHEASAAHVRCESRNGHFKRCQVDTGRHVRLERRLSDEPCIEDRTWGFDPQGIWVDRGCRADFLVGRGEVPWVPGRFRTIICASDDHRYRYCRIETDWLVRLSERLSDRPCIQGRTWGFDERGIWVDQGCRARFTVGAPGVR